MRMTMAVFLFVPSILHPLKFPDAFCASRGAAAAATNERLNEGRQAGRKEGGEKKTKARASRN